MIDIELLRHPYFNEDTRRHMDGDVGRTLMFMAGGVEVTATLLSWTEEWLAVKSPELPNGYGFVAPERCSFAD